jgi:NADH-quinone oxidoreductase subunit C
VSEEKFPEQLAIEKRFPAAVLDWHAQHGDRTLLIEYDKILDIARLLRDELGYNVPRFEVVYHFMNLATLARLRVKVQPDDEHPEVPSLTSLWAIADWYEREVWDLFGVKFHGHPHLKRIMLYEEFKGHPLRKDYPKTKRQPLIGLEN